MKTFLAAPLLLLALGSIAEAQAPPLSTPPTFGFSLPSVEGTMTYSLSAGESFFTGYGGGGVDTTTSLSGTAAYLSSSPDKPFSLVYSGGYLYSTVPGSPSSTTFQNLAASQVIATKNWNFVVDDSFSFLPESPTTGLSGIPGVGDVGVVPVEIGDQPGQAILTNYANRIGNGLNGGATRKFGAKWAVNGSASWQILHFFGNEGIDSTTYLGSVGPTYHIDARSTAGITANYSYTNNSYLGVSYPFETESVTFQYQRQLNRFFAITVSGGPQRTSGSGASDAFIPTQITGVGTASLTYSRRTTTATITYSRSTNSGSGVVFGALTDSVFGSVRRQFSRDWQGALTASYSQNDSLATIAGLGENYRAIFGGGQVSRRLGRSLSAYFSYTAVTQDGNYAAGAPLAFSGLSQVFSVGLTYSPGAQHFGH